MSEVVQVDARRRLIETSPQQEHVAELLALGLSQTRAADEAGVDRGTVRRWLHHPGFTAEFNRRRIEVRAEMRARAREIVTKAFGSVDNALDEGNPQIAIAFLRLFYSAPFFHEDTPQLPTDAEEILREQAKGADKRMLDEIGSDVPGTVRTLIAKVEADEDL